MFAELNFQAADIAGVDEAGRGPLIGDVFASAVILPEHYDLPKLNDSKKLSEKTRETLEKMIKKQSLAWSVASATVEEIETLNILGATMLAMKRALETLPMTPKIALIDGNHIPPNLHLPARAIIKGDSQVAAIAAASILAKTARDRQVIALAERHPGYGFERHKGYGTAEHLAAMQRLGLLPEHRKHFAPVRKLLATTQAEMTCR